MKKYLLLLLLLSSSTLFPMARKFGQFAQKAFAKTCTAAHWSIATLPTTATGFALYDLTKKDARKEESAASPLVKEFAREQMQIIGVKNSHSVPVVSYSHSSLMAAMPFPARLIIDTTIEQDCAKKLLRKQELNNQHYLVQKFGSLTKKRAQEIANLEHGLNGYKGVLQHEAAHIKNHDIEKKVVVNACIPFIVHAGYKGLQRAVPKPSFTVPSFVQSCMRIPTGFGKLLTSIVALSLYSKNFEQRADDSIQNKKEILQACAAFIKKEDTEVRQSIPDHWPAWKKKLFYNAHFAVHPTNAKRIKKLEQRIAALENTSEKTPSDG